MSPSSVPPNVLRVWLISDLANNVAAPTLACSRLSRAMPAGLPKRVLASCADEDRPAKPDPIPLMLCSLSAKPPASTLEDASTTARPTGLLSFIFFMAWTLWVSLKENIENYSAPYYPRDQFDQ
ncbi:hypothetical protein D3C87_1678700 [compost metagenome]